MLHLPFRPTSSRARPGIRLFALALLLCLALVGGAAADPFEVATYADLCKVGTGTDGWTLDATYTQTADIQCPAGANFTPIGDGYDFTGSYDGQGYVIRNLTISRPDRSNNALFEFADKGAVFTNIHLEDISITGTDYAGGLISAEWGDEPGDILIENCTVTGVIETRDTYGCNIGGLAGYLEGATIVGCHTDVLMYNGLGADGEVTTVGGLIGYAAVCNISDSSANGNISNCGDMGGA